ncbi:MAG: 2-dehydropantoate 2-reductase, partial [Myxococcota bacterium]
KIGIMGAGSIGCFVGGRLAAIGEDVCFVGRQPLGDEIATHGMQLTAVDGTVTALSPDQVSWTTDAAALSDCAVVFVAVKGLATDAVARELRGILAEDCAVFSLQNGVTNAGILRDHLGPRVVAPCMVSFNVLRRGEGRFLQGTGGPLALGTDAPADVVRRLQKTGLEVSLHDDMRAVLWGKLLINLNNAINALADVPLLDEFRDRRLRRVLAAAIVEGRAALTAAGIRPVSFLPVPYWVLTGVLRLPTWAFVRIARSMVAIDPQARSSMWEDLQRGRQTEVHLLNGAVVDLGRRYGIPTPVNAQIVAAISAAERGEDTQNALDVLIRLVSPHPGG